MKTKDLNELKEWLRELEKEAEANKKKREYKTTAIFAVVFFLIFYFFEGKPEGIDEVFSYLLTSVIMAALHFAINHEVFESIIEKEEADRKMLVAMRKRISEAEDRIKGGDAENI